MTCLHDAPDYVNLSPRLEASTWSAKEDMDATGGRGSRVHNRLAVVIGAGSLVVEVATALAGQAQQWVSEFVPCGGLSWLPVSFLLHVKYTLSYRIVYRIVAVCQVGVLCQNKTAKDTAIVVMEWE